MREERITLENSINVALVRRHSVDLLPVKKDISRIWLNKSADNTQSCCFTTTGRTKESYKFLIVNIKVDSLENSLSIKFYHYVF